MLDELLETARIIRIRAADRAQDELEIGFLERVEDPPLHVDHILRAGIVIDKADQVRPAQGQRPGLRVGRIAELGDDRLDDLPGARLDQRAVIDDARHGLLRHLRDARDIVDRCPALKLELSGFLHGGREFGFELRF